VKPLGYAGDFQVLEMLVRNQCTSRGLAFHFDRSQLDSLAAQACRERISWVCQTLADWAVRERRQSMALLDLGVGGAPVEQQLARQHPGIKLRLHAVDFEPAALRRVEEVMAASPIPAKTWRLNLREAAALPAVRDLAGEVDACVALGLLEALPDREALPLLQAVISGLRPGAIFCVENFVPNHPTRSLMEWFMDFSLCCRSPEQLAALVRKAGAAERQIHVRMDSTGSLALLTLTA
jgi:hypothetical protein